MITQGVDIVEIARIAKAGAHNAFLRRIYTAAELELIADVSETRKWEVLAGRFAAKEATIKALGSIHYADSQAKEQPESVRWNEIETVRAPNGAPVLHLYGQALQKAIEHGFSHFHISISHTAEWAVAFVVFE